MKLFNFKSFSWKIAITIVIMLLVVTGAVAGYYQLRVLQEIDRGARLNIRYMLLDAADQNNPAFGEAMHSARSIRRTAEAIFDTGGYTGAAEDFFADRIRPPVSGMIKSVVSESYYVSGAFFAVHPNLVGQASENKIFYEMGTAGVVEGLVQSYEAYFQVDSPDMEWFFGAYNSRLPYWTRIRALSDGEFLLSYAEPVFANGSVIGVAGVHMHLGRVIDRIREKSVYDTGFAFIEDVHGDFIGSVDFISRLSQAEREMIGFTADTKGQEVFEITVGGIAFVAAAQDLMNGYRIYMFAPFDEYNYEAWISLIRFPFVFIALTIIITIASRVIGKKMGAPLVFLTNFLERASVTGDASLTQEDKLSFEKYAYLADEIGQCLKSAAAFTGRIREVSKDLEAIAGGDLTVQISALSDWDVMAISLQHMNDNLSEMFSDIKSVSEQVSTGAKHIANGSQAIAQDAMEQASLVNTLSNSASGISQKTKDNADTAKNAAELASTIMGSAEEGSVRMREMLAAVNEINDANQSIGKIIKTIDDIAFQTNILALNAAVEAARAGQHGKGFAVVADEVRNLAAKSAEAARETGVMIQNSMDKAKLGVSIASGASSSFSDIASGINKSSQLIKDIAKSSEEQISDIEHINESISVFTEVVQKNSSTSEASAAASEEMSAQSMTLQNLMSRFKIKN